MHVHCIIITILMIVVYCFYAIVKDGCMDCGCKLLLCSENIETNARIKKKKQCYKHALFSTPIHTHTH